MADELELHRLVDRARENDPDAWEALYVRLYARLLDYARRRLPTREEADDAVSEAFARAFASIERFRWTSDAGFDGWMYGIVRNVVLESRRRTRPSDELVADAASADPEPLDRVLADEEAAAVRQAFARLRPQDRELLELRVVGELGAEEVASVLNKRPGAISMAQSRALNRLRRLMLESEHA